jgi:hypothetical protein
MASDSEGFRLLWFFTPRMLEKRAKEMIYSPLETLTVNHDYPKLEYSRIENLKDTVSIRNLNYLEN